MESKNLKKKTLEKKKDKKSVICKQTAIHWVFSSKIEEGEGRGGGKKKRKKEKKKEGGGGKGRGGERRRRV